MWRSAVCGAERGSPQVWAPGISLLPGGIVSATLEVVLRGGLCGANPCLQGPSGSMFGSFIQCAALRCG